MFAQKKTTNVTEDIKKLLQTHRAKMEEINKRMYRISCFRDAAKQRASTLKGAGSYLHKWIH